MNILITGAAGFIGFHLSNLFLNNNHKVIGIDNLCKSYGVKFKKERLKILKKSNNFKFYKIDIKNINKIKEKKIDYIIHLAAQAGVRLSQEKPELFLNDNILGTLKIFEFAKKNKITKIFYASSSSVYGNSNIFPSSEKININKPLSIYGITKSTNEDLAYYYNFVYGISSIGFRFFTVYGPYGRPDMALFKFTKNILENKKIELFNNGNHSRDFTYIADIVSGISSVIKKPKKTKIPFNIFNIGRGDTQKLKYYLSNIEKKLNKKAKIKKIPLQLGDIKKTHSDISSLKKFSNYRPNIDIEKGISEFIDWYLTYYQKK